MVGRAAGVEKIHSATVLVSRAHQIEGSISDLACVNRSQRYRKDACSFLIGAFEQEQGAEMIG